jgi:hypothetical protein
MTETTYLMNLIIGFLTPMLLDATGGDRAQAEKTAIQTVNAYAIRNPAELLLVGQSIALGIAMLSSVSLSIAENIPIGLILRLRANAVSLHRAAEQCRRALPRPDPDYVAPTPEVPLSDAELAREQRVIAGIAESRQRLADFQASFAQPKPSQPQPSQPQTTKPQPNPETPPATMQAAMAALAADSERRIAQADAAMKATGAAIPPKGAAPMTEDDYFRAAWSAAMTDVAAEMQAEMENLPPAERRLNAQRIQALNDTVDHLANPTPQPPR